MRTAAWKGCACLHESRPAMTEEIGRTPTSRRAERFEMARLAEAISFCITETFRVAMRPGDTPVPIPNTMVKTWTADGTMLETAWESRWLPGSLKKDLRTDGVRSEGRMYIENCTQRVIEKITTSDSYYKIEEKNHSVTV